MLELEPLNVRMDYSDDNSWEMRKVEGGDGKDNNKERELDREA